MSDFVISVRHLSKSYGQLRAVQDVSFDVHGSTCAAFLGPNGAGKTTMMKVLYGKATADENAETAMEVFGYDPRSQHLEIKALAGIVPQEDSLDVELDVEQNLRVYARFSGIVGKAAGERIAELLEFMELEEKRKSRVRELSGGMKRRLIIARSLLNNPRLLILDEPTTGLDPQVRQLIWDKLRTLMKRGVTILLTTHYMEEAFQLADEVTIMDHGRMVLSGNPNTLLAEQIEADVLEVISPEAAERLVADGLPGDVRREDSGERVLFYSNSEGLINQMARRLGAGEYYQRKSNLEDLFLKATGRRLNEQQ
jgi:lipooligosaccharide transport system ATP-binding protein